MRAPSSPCHHSVREMPSKLVVPGISSNTNACGNVMRRSARPTTGGRTARRPFPIAAEDAHGPDVAEHHAEPLTVAQPLPPPQRRRGQHQHRVNRYGDAQNAGARRVGVHQLQSGETQHGRHPDPTTADEVGAGKPVRRHLTEESAAQSCGHQRQGLPRAEQSPDVAEDSGDEQQPHPEAHVHGHRGDRGVGAQLAEQRRPQHHGEHRQPEKSQHHGETAGHRLYHVRQRTGAEAPLQAGLRPERPQEQEGDEQRCRRHVGEHPHGQRQVAAHPDAVCQHACGNGHET